MWDGKRRQEDRKAELQYKSSTDIGTYFSGMYIIIW